MGAPGRDINDMADKLAPAAVTIRWTCSRLAAISRSTWQFNFGRAAGGAFPALAYSFSMRACQGPGAGHCSVIITLVDKPCTESHCSRYGEGKFCIRAMQF